MQKRERKLKIRVDYLQTPLWIIQRKGFSDARKGVKHGDARLRADRFITRRTETFELCWKMLGEDLEKYSKRNDLVNTVSKIAASLDKTEERLRRSGDEDEYSRAWAEHRRKQLKKSVDRISGMVTEAEKQANEAKSQCLSGIDAELKAYYRGMARYLRDNKGYYSIDPEKVSLRSFFPKDKLYLFGSIRMSIPKLTEAITKLGDN